MKIFTLCKPYLLEHKFKLVVYIVIALSSIAISILSPYIIGDFLDDLIAGGDIGVILRFCMVFGGLSILRIIKNYTVSAMYLKMQTQMAYKLNRSILRHIQSLSLSYVKKQDIAYLSQRIGSDSHSVIIYCISLLRSFLTNTVMLIVPFVILFAMHRFIALLLIGFLFLYVLIYRGFEKSLYNAGLEHREMQNKFFSSLFEQLKYIKLIKINSIQPEINKRAEIGFKNYIKAAIHNQKVNYLYSGLDSFISTIAQIILYVVGGIQILAGNFSIGMFTIFASYFKMMLEACRYFFGVGVYYQSTLVSYDRIQEILAESPETCGEKIINSVNKLAMQNINYSPIPGKKVFENFNAEFTTGKIYAVAGANGTGKSTLVNLLLGMYIDEYAGSITYDSVNIRHIDMVDARRNLIGFAEQEPTLLNDTICNNLFMEDIADIKYEALDNLINILNMQDFISKNGLDFYISEKNTNISGGEKQKISILKVLYKNPPLMIFDEPTSAFDIETTQKFIKYLTNICKDKIIIIITHDPFIQSLCNVVTKLGT